MNARLLIMEPQKVWGVPIESPLVIEENGSLVVCTSDWAVCIEGANLEAVTTDDLREPLHLGPNELPVMYLSPVRELPDDDLTSPALLHFVRHWWMDEVVGLLRVGQIANAPALKTLA